MNSLLYDGTFEGMLSVVYAVYYRKLDPAVIATGTGKDKEELLGEGAFIATDDEHARRVAQGVVEKIGPFAFRDLYRYFLSETPGRELHLLAYLRLGFRVGGMLERMTYEPRVREVRERAVRVGREVHRMMGFVRFSELEDGRLFARLAPRYDILALLPAHFAARLGNAPFILYDEKRQKLLFCENGEWEILSGFLHEAPRLSEAEDAYRELWRTFFDAVAVEERKNPKLQRQFVPRYYRKQMTEFQEREEMR